MLLMLKDLPVLRADFETYEFDVLVPELLPFYLKDKINTAVRSVTINGMTAKSVKGQSAARDIMGFLASRVLPLSRANAGKIYDLLGVSQEQTDENKARISLMCRAVSLADDYWVKDEDDLSCWKDVSIRDNHLNEIFTQTALHGTPLTLAGNLCTPEVSTNGTYAKAWKREEDGSLWLYKKGFRGNFESKVEVMVSNLLDHFNVGHVHYEAAEDNGEYCCKCPCMTDARYSIVDAGTMEAYFNRCGRAFLPYIQKHFSDDLYKMWIIDYLISNSDRHSQNWGFQYVSDTMQIVGLHPLFDHNNAFDPDLMYDPDVPYIACSDHTMRSAARYARKHVDFHYFRDFTKQDFLTQRQYISFTDRLKELQIGMA